MILNQQLKYMKTNILTFIILILLAIIFLQRCGGGPKYIKEPTTSIVIHDTIVIHDSVISHPKLVYVKADTNWMHDTLYTPGKTFEKVVVQYDSLGDRYFSKRIYATPFKLGEYGDAIVTDTVSSNLLVGSSIKYSIRVPKETVTVHEYTKPTRQLYIGGGLFGNKQIGLSGGFVGGLYKDRKDRIFGVNVGYSSNGIVYGISSYWKIVL